LLEPEEEPKQGGLAASVRARDPHELVFFDREIDVPEHLGAVWVGEGNAA
jgi:hypothetical protein